MDKMAKIYVAGHTGLVGSALVRALQARGYTNFITRTHAELDLERQSAVEAFFETEKPEYVFLAAAKVGGIWANKTYPAEFIYNNLAIQTNVIHSAWKAGVKRLLFLGSSCIYPRDCGQPMKEEYLLTGPLETTNEPYAVAKISGVEMCQSYNRQYGTSFISVMPTNLFGPNDNFNLETSHVLPALIRKFHLAKLSSHGDWQAIQKDESLYGPIPEDILANLISISRTNGYEPPLPAARLSRAKSRGCPLPADPAVVTWGTGSPRREFLHVDDLADACFFLMTLPVDRLNKLLFLDSSSKPADSMPHVHPVKFASGDYFTGAPCPVPLINIGWGKDISIKELAMMIKDIVGFAGDIVFDTTKPDGTPRKLLDITRMAELGWKARIPIKEGIEQTYSWYLGKSGN
jgi:GDP-L-fucose synthase